MTIYNYFQNTGGINKCSSEASLNDGVSDTDWLDAKNVEGYKDGGIAKMKGNFNILNPALGPNVKILGIFDYVKGQNHYLIFTTSEGKVYCYYFANHSYIEVYSGLDTSARCCFANYNNGVVITNGVDTPVFYEEDGNVTKLSSDTPIGQSVAVFRSRLFIASGSSLHFCALGNPNDWTSSNDAGYITNFHNDSSPIVALKNYGEYIAIYKRQGTYVLSGTAPDDFTIQAVVDRGAVSPWAVVTVDDVQYFFDGNVISSLNFNALGQITVADEISTKIRPLFSELNTGKLTDFTFIPYPKKNQIWFYMGTTVDENLDICYVYDYYLNAWYIRSGLPVTCGALVDGVIYTGSASGMIYQEDYGDSFNGGNIEAYWCSPWFTFKAPGVLKQLNELDMWIYQDQSLPIDVTYYTDYSTDDKTPTEVKVISSSDLVWADSATDVSTNSCWDTFNWSNTSPIKKKLPIQCSFESLQIKVGNSLVDQPFSIIGFSFNVDMST